VDKQHRPSTAMLLRAPVAAIIISRLSVPSVSELESKSTEGNVRNIIHP